MIRWVASTFDYNRQDHEVLHRIIVYPAGTKKEQVKAEHEHHERMLLVPEGILLGFPNERA